MGARIYFAKGTCPERSERGKVTSIERMPQSFSRDFDNSFNLDISPNTSASFFARDQRLICPSRLLASKLVRNSSE
jgi:hypothetical protein